MNIIINNQTFDFQPWRPEHGQVFAQGFAFDSETTLIDEVCPWLTPAYVLGAACDGQRGVFVQRDHVAAFFAAHRDVPIVMHNAPFDLAVLDLVAPDVGIYDRVDRDLVWDTRLLHRLYMLGSEGHTAHGKRQSTLDHCATAYLGITLPKDVKDSRGNPVRLSYGQWLGRPPNEIEPVYLEYLAQDAIVTHWLLHELDDRLQQLLETAHDAFGYVTPAWLAEQCRRWGPQTHHVQLKAAIVLNQITANGLCVDRERREELACQLDAVAEEGLATLRAFGYMPGQQGSGKALQEILVRLEAQRPDHSFPRTATGKYATSREVLEDLAGSEPFVAAYLHYSEIQKLRATFVDKLARPVVHPSFDVLKTTGRTSSFGELNAQNLPRDDRVRACFVPSAGHLFLSADYKTVELATLGQALKSQFSLRPYVIERINEGRDLHRLMAARVANKDESDVTADERQKAKAINFGKPGGMGHEGLKRYARASYGVGLSDAEVVGLSNAWFTEFPEMRIFLARENDRVHAEVATLFRLTPESYYSETGNTSFLRHPDAAGLEDLPHPILGAMCLKVLRESEPCRSTGVPYPAAEIDYFWAQVIKQVALLPKAVQQPVRQRRPSPQVQRAVLRLADRAAVITATGRLRANASFTARHNTLFQGLAADGAKLALWRLWRAGYRIVNFIHDEVLIEVSADENLTLHAQTIRQLMIEAMQEVVPDVLIDVEYAAAARWYKSAEAMYDTDGKLLPWTPPEPGAEGEPLPSAAVGPFSISPSAYTMTA